MSKPKLTLAQWRSAIEGAATEIALMSTLPKIALLRPP